LFQAHGTVTSAKVITDRQRGRPRGFGFVEVQRSEDAHKAIESRDGREFRGRTLKVNLSRPREERLGRYGR
jgi:RNA recognition motif-containing protein